MKKPRTNPILFTMFLLQLSSLIGCAQSRSVLEIEVGIEEGWTHAIMASSLQAEDGCEGFFGARPIDGVTRYIEFDEPTSIVPREGCDLQTAIVDDDALRGVDPEAEWQVCAMIQFFNCDLASAEEQCPPRLSDLAWEDESWSDQPGAARLLKVRFERPFYLGEQTYWRAGTCGGWTLESSMLSTEEPLSTTEVNVGRCGILNCTADEDDLPLGFDPDVDPEFEGGYCDPRIRDGMGRWRTFCDTREF